MFHAVTRKARSWNAPIAICGAPVLMLQDDSHPTPGMLAASLFTGDAAQYDICPDCACHDQVVGLIQLHILENAG